MLRYVTRRIFLLALTLFISSIVIFALTQLLPGDVARLVLGRDATPEAVANFRVQMGLNDPAPQQYLRWLTGMVNGTWGKSFSGGNAPIRPLVMQRLGNSMRLALLTMILSVPLSILLGVLAAIKENTWVDSAISVFSLSVVGLPEFVTGLVLINTLALGLSWFPASSSPPSSGAPGDWLRQLFLPAVAATLVLLGYLVRMVRAGVIDELKKPYVRTAILKGLPQRQIIFKHVLRNALLPTITVIAISFGWLIGGLIVIENVFNFPGLGKLVVAAVSQKDIPLIQAVVMTAIFFYALANLIADLLYTLLNPRIRLE